MLCMLYAQIQNINKDRGSDFRWIAKLTRYKEDEVPRIAGVDIPKDKRIVIALTYIYGIGRKISSRVLKEANIDENVRAKDLSDEEVKKIAGVIQTSVRVEGDLRREVSGNIKRLLMIGSYKGIRHRKGLPARGQRTKTNARTRKGPKKTIAGKKKTAGLK